MENVCSPIAAPLPAVKPEDRLKSLADASKICFLIDLPRLPAGQTADLSTQFGIELAYFLAALGLEQKIVDSLKKYDFSRTTNIAFVHTM